MADFYRPKNKNHLLELCILLQGGLEDELLGFLNLCLGVLIPCIVLGWEHQIVTEKENRLLGRFDHLLGI